MGWEPESFHYTKMIFSFLVGTGLIHLKQKFNCVGWQITSFKFTVPPSFHVNGIVAKEWDPDIDNGDISLDPDKTNNLNPQSHPVPLLPGEVACPTENRLLCLKTLW